MKTKEKQYKFIAWKSPEEMHHSSLQWLSELNFIKDEHHFLNELIRSFTLQITNLGLFEKSRDLVMDISNSELQVDKSLKKVRIHENQLSIMIDDVDQPKMEKAYTETHRDLMIEIDAYCKSYRSLKASLFSMLSSIMKKEKQKRLLN